MSFASRYFRGSMKSFLKNAEENLGVIVSEEEINALVEAGKIEKDNYNCIPHEDVEMVSRWVKRGRPDPSTWDEQPLFSTSNEGSPTPSDFGGISGDASDRLFKLTMDRMKEKGIPYSVALGEVQSEHPDLARQIAEGLEAFRKRDKKTASGF